jgi:two-component system cell cycle response regulator CpdR
MPRILIAEDDTAVREFVRRALEHGGHQVHTAHDGLDALDALSEGDYDLLITDIVMPGLDGIALALKVAKEHPQMAILMMTGYAAERQRAHNLDVLIHQVVAKPFSLREICDAAESAMLAKARSRSGGDVGSGQTLHAPA